MELYYHHVGQQGAAEDFPKTVWSPVDWATIQQVPFPDQELKGQVVDTLSRTFPSGRFNCWGVPAGARNVLRHLSQGDAVLLVESIAPGDVVPALCIVDAFWPVEVRDLSERLWGNHKYPYVFYFSTEELRLEWQDFREDVGFAPEFNPRGQFYRVRAERLNKFGGASGYIAHLRENYSPARRDSGPSAGQVAKEVFAPPSARELREAHDPSGDPVTPVELGQELSIIGQLSLAPIPLLTGGAGHRETRSSSPARDAAFHLAVRRLYGDRCAVCGSGLRGPRGEPEVNSAHIYPKRLDGSDDVRNGVCLCRLHHWAFDIGWFSMTDDCIIMVRAGLPDTDEYGVISSYKGKRLRLPVEPALAPHPVFLREHRKLQGLP